MKYYIFLDHFDWMPVIAGLADRTDHQIVIYVGVPDQLPPVSGRLFDWKTVTAEKLHGLGITADDRIIICAADPDRFTAVIEQFPPEERAPAILLLTEKPTALATGARPNISVINLPAMAQAHLSNEWRLIHVRQKAYRLWRLLSGAQRVLIMTQHDPDPDAIASGLAIQTLIGGGPETAPICSLGKVTRNENVSMIKLLDIGVRTITPEEIAGFERIVMVDVQPPYFEPGLFPRVDAVIDHHPYSGDYEAAFRDINISYGATATMMSEYLAAGGIAISQRLATALLYGVITDTMLLARESSTRDFEAFSMLWPLANHQTLASMSRPRLDPEELDYFVRAINNRKVVRDLLYIWLGQVKKEDIIPRLADFSLQIGDAIISAVAGVCKRQIVVSIRSASPANNVGKIAEELFSAWGSAGGRHTMAKAVIPLTRFKREMKLSSIEQVGEKILELISRARTERAI